MNCLAQGGGTHRMQTADDPVVNCDQVLVGSLVSASLSSPAVPVATSGRPVTGSAAPMGAHADRSDTQPCGRRPHADRRILLARRQRA